MEISKSEFAFYMQQLGPFESGSILAVATSGGPDSLCLTLLLSQWSYQHHCTVRALIVDHQLRRESTREALQTAAQIKNMGVKTAILTWQGDKPITRIQETARHKRYELMLNWCRQHNCRYLFTGHHRQDQYETALWRLWRGSDIWGLAGISAQIQKDNIIICRPLLQVSKQRIEQTLESTSLQPVRDPSNANEKFSRVVIRNKLSQLPTLPINMLGQLRIGFENWRANFIKLNVKISPYGYLIVNFIQFQQLSSPFQQFLLNHLIAVIGCQQYPIGRHKLANIILRMLESPEQIYTLGGCIIYIRHQNLFIMREWAQIQILPLSHVDPSHCINWDGRFKFENDVDKQHITSIFELRSMGENGWAQLCHAHQTALLMAIPYHARLALPTLWYGNQIKSVCHFPTLLNAGQFSMQPVFNPAIRLLPPIFKALIAQK